jgi:membrane protease YdiL (CAAX protease family)
MKRLHEGFWTLLFAAAAVGLALAAHREAWAAGRWALLALAGIGVCGGWITLQDPLGTIFGRSRDKGVGWWIAAAVGMAVLAGVAYRRLLGKEYFPMSLQWFAVVAMAVGTVEEVLWRGWVQGVWARLFGSTTAVFAAAGAHAAYKTALFVFPPDGVTPQAAGGLLFVAGTTFGVGAILGWMRARQGTIAAPVAFHVLFDLLVYGQYAGAPWWVWQ